VQPRALDWAIREPSRPERPREGRGAANYITSVLYIVTSHAATAPGGPGCLRCMALDAGACPVLPAPPLASPSGPPRNAAPPCRLPAPGTRAPQQGTPHRGRLTSSPTCMRSRQARSSPRWRRRGACFPSATRSPTTASAASKAGAWL